MKSVMHGKCDPRPTVIFPAEDIAGTKLYCLVTEADVCDQLAQGRNVVVEWPGAEPAICGIASQRPNHYTTGLCRYGGL